jgi:starvation-inducible DNA-binding protein
LWGRDALEVPTDLSPNAVEQISSALRELLADVVALYVKTKNFHWHMSGRHFPHYHLLLDEHAEQIFAMTDKIAERSRKIGEPRTNPAGPGWKLAVIRPSSPSRWQKASRCTWLGL